MTNALETWCLDAAKQVCLTTDNASNMVCATSLRLKLNHLPCFGHNLHLAIENSINTEMRVHRALGISCKLVGSFTHSWNRKREIEQGSGATKSASAFSGSQLLHPVGLHKKWRAGC